MRKVSFLILVVLALLVGLFPFVFYYLKIPFEIIESKDNKLLSDILWIIGFHTHIIFGAIALLVGWVGFSEKIKIKYLIAHRIIGKLYIISAIISSISAVFSSFYVTGGDISFMGFMLLALIWLISTILGYINIKKDNVMLHQKMMIYSYAACFSGVTLRLWLPLLSLFINQFFIAYSIAAWLCWIPNLTVAYIIVQKIDENKFLTNQSQ